METTTTTDPFEPVPDKRTAFISGLRELADLLESTPALHGISPQTILLSVNDGEHDEQMKLLGTTEDMLSLDKTFVVHKRHFGPLTVGIYRGMKCRKIEIGTQKVKRYVVTTPAEYEYVEVEEPIYSIVCE